MLNSDKGYCSPTSKCLQVYDCARYVGNVEPGEANFRGRFTTNYDEMCENGTCSMFIKLEDEDAN
jgi:hypothetical protein